MCRYSDSLTALNAALNLMVDEGDTLLVAAIAHPLHRAENRLSDQHGAIIAAAVQTIATGPGSMHHR